jgi:sugar O-acyltransferase (sialic acid O-acetyltransferase NeuD family)
MPDERVIVVGAGGHAGVVLDAVACQGRYRVVGLVDSVLPAGARYLGYEVIGDEAALPALARALDARLVVVALGDNWQRRALAERFEQVLGGPRFGTVVHPAASVAPDIELGVGTMVLAGAVLVRGCRVGRGCIVNTHASLDHDGVLEDYASLGPGAVTGGNVRVGTCTAVGLGARVVHGVTIGRHSVVGAGALVLEDVPSGVVAYGAPARVVRKRQPDEPYL